MADRVASSSRPSIVLTRRSDIGHPAYLGLNNEPFKVKADVLPINDFLSQS